MPDLKSVLTVRRSETRRDMRACLLVGALLIRQVDYNGRSLPEENRDKLRQRKGGRDKPKKRGLSHRIYNHSYRIYIGILQA